MAVVSKFMPPHAPASSLKPKAKAKAKGINHNKPSTSKAIKNTKQETQDQGQTTPNKKIQPRERCRSSKNNSWEEESGAKNETENGRERGALAAKRFPSLQQVECTATITTIIKPIHDDKSYKEAARILNTFNRFGDIIAKSNCDNPFDPKERQQVMDRLRSKKLLIEENMRAYQKINRKREAARIALQNVVQTVFFNDAVECEKEFYRLIHT